MMDKRRKIGFFVGPIIFLLCLILPTPGDMSPAAIRTAAVAFLMSIWWITEAIPIPATALLPIALFPSLGIMKSSASTTPYANHLVFLFLGGFMIAVTMERWNLHKRIALQTIRIVGTSPGRIVLGFMIATAFLSMWISNTATAMMMVPIGLAVISQAADFLKEKNDPHIDVSPGNFRFGTALMLSIAYAASIGGVATIIGTPPNTFLVGFVEKTYGQQISFTDWLLIGVPLAAVMLVISWLYLVRFALPPEIKELPGGRKIILDELKKLGPISRPEKSVLAVFFLVALSWIVRGFIDVEELSMVHDATIAIFGAVLLFCIPVDFDKGIFLLDWKTAVKIPWDVILLFGGGLALASGFEISGLAKWLGDQLSGLQGFSLLILIPVLIFLSMMLTEVTSNTATAAMLIPVMGSISIAMGVHPFGPMLAACIGSSYAFMLPVATPPNAVVFGSKYISIPQMARVGVILNIIGTFLITLVILKLVPWIWHINLLAKP